MTNFLYALIILEAAAIVGLVVKIQWYRMNERKYRGLIEQNIAWTSGMTDEIDSAIKASGQVN